MRRFEGRVAVVTGAASGIGRAVALALARRGCELAIVDIDETGLLETARLARELEARVSTHRVDVADVGQMRALPGEVVAEHGDVHILVNNAGVSVTGTIEEQSLEDFEWIVGINFWGVVYGCKFFLPHLRRADEAHIVNISSVFGIIGLPTQGSYNATKFAVRGVSEALHAELAGTNVGVSCVHPAGVQTNIARSARMVDEEERARAQRVFDRIGVTPEHAAGKIVRGIERKRLRVRICKETYLVDWLVRLAPVTVHRLLAVVMRRAEARRAAEA